MIVPKATYRLWVSPEPHCLADITGCLVDITEAKSCIERLLVISPTSDDRTVADALSIAAVVRYCRCFTTGNRQMLDIKILSTATCDEVSVHERIRGIRDWHVAHPVNLQEVHALHLIVNKDPTASELVLGISSYQANSLLLTVEELNVALSLCRKWISFLQSKMVEEQLRLRPYVEQLSREHVLALPIEEPEPNSNISARRSKKR